MDFPMKIPMEKSPRKFGKQGIEFPWGKFPSVILPKGMLPVPAKLSEVTTSPISWKIIAPFSNP